MPHRFSVSTAMVLALSLAARPLSAQAPIETVHVVIAGGANAGTYDASGTRGGCTANATGPGSFGNQLSSPIGDAKAFNSLQLVVPNAKAAASGTSEFEVIVGFGPLMKRSASYTVNTLSSAKAKTGSGTVKLTDAGATAKVDIAAVTADGVKINATITCNKVMRM